MKNTMKNKINLTHFDQSGQAHMVNVGEKPPTKRIAIAQGKIFISSQAFECIQLGNSKKGDVLGIARIAAIQASKQTAQLIPLCHPISLSHVSIQFELNEIEHSVLLRATTETVGQTGVEMEALCAVNIGLMTIYDMLKAIDKYMLISDVQLMYKEGGRSGQWKR